MKLNADLIEHRPNSLLPEMGIAIDEMLEKISQVVGGGRHVTSLIGSFHGDRSVAVGRISAVERFEPGDLIFVDKPDVANAALERSRQVGLPALIVTSLRLADTYKVLPGANVLQVKDVPLAHALIKQVYASRDFSRCGWTGVHSSAVVHETANLDSTVVVEPRAVIGARAQVSRGVRIMAGTILENDVWIGENTILHPGVVVGYGCVIGDNVVIEGGTVIGSAGFGYAQDENRKSHVIPQTGIVVIEDRVRIGAGCCIDRAAYHLTKIGAGTKIDNLCHIAHGVQIGEDCLLTAMLCVAGSTKIGDRVMTSGQTGILDHINVCSDVVLVHRAGVTKDIHVPGAYGGLPTQPLAEYMKNAVVVKNAVDLRRRVANLEEKLST